MGSGRIVAGYHSCFVGANCGLVEVWSLRNNAMMGQQEAKKGRRRRRLNVRRHQGSGSIQNQRKYCHPKRRGQVLCVEGCLFRDRAPQPSDAATSPLRVVVQPLLPRNDNGLPTVAPDDGDGMGHTQIGILLRRCHGLRQRRHRSNDDMRKKRKR